MKRLSEERRWTVNKRVGRRTFLGIAAATVGGGVLAACAPPAAPTAVPSDAKVEEPDVPAEPETVSGRIALEMWMWETEPRWLQVQELAGLSEEFPNVDFKWTALPYMDLHQKALTAMAAGLPEGLPSVVRTGANFYRPFVEAGALMDVTQQVTPHEEDVMPFAWGEAIIDGKAYQVPDDTGVMMFGYRWDIFEEAGLPSEPNEVLGMLQTYEDLISLGRTLGEATGAKLLNMLPDAGVFNPIMIQDSTGYFDEGGNVIMDSDYHFKVAETVKNLYDSGLTTRYEQGPQIWQAYKDGELACMFYPNWQDFVVIDNAPETAGKWRVTKVPAVQPGGRRASMQNGCLLVIPAIKPLEEREMALKFALYMKFTVKATVAHMQTFSGAFVSYIPGLEAMAEQPSPILDEQFVYKLYLDTAREEEILPWYRSSTVNYVEAQTAAAEAMFKILEENASIEQSLTEAANSVRRVQESTGTV